MPKDQTKNQSTVNQNKEKKAEAQVKINDTALEIENLKKQLIEAEDKYLRLYAEFDNYRKRRENEKNEFTKYACTSIIEALLPVLDSFGNSWTSFEKENCGLDDLKKGFALIHKQLEDILLKFGVTKIEAVGKSFDPKFHEAVMQKEAKDVPAQTVLEELQTGYLIHDRVLRPVMVIVSK